MSAKSITNESLVSWLTMAMEHVSDEHKHDIIAMVLVDTAIALIQEPDEQNFYTARLRAAKMYRTLYKVTSLEAALAIRKLMETRWSPLDEYIHLGDGPSHENFDNYVRRLAGVEKAKPQFDDCGNTGPWTIYAEDDPEYADRGGSHYEEHPEEYQ